MTEPTVAEYVEALATIESLYPLIFPIIEADHGSPAIAAGRPPLTLTKLRRALQLAQFAIHQRTLPRE